MKVKLILSLLLVSISLFADLGTRIDKTTVENSESKTVRGDFSRVVVTGPINVILEPSSESRIQVDCPKDLEDKISVQISGGLAEIRFKDSFFFSSKNKRIQVYVFFKDLKDLSVKGFGYIISAEKMKLSDFKLSKKGPGKIKLNLNANIFELSLKGSNQVTLNGKANLFRATLMPSSQVAAEDFEVENADLLLKGSSKIVLHANSNLRVHASGNAQVLYKGNPNVSLRKESGSSQVQPL